MDQLRELMRIPLSLLNHKLTYFHQSVNLVSLFLGQFRVASHVGPFCLAVRDRLLIQLQLAFLASGGVEFRRV